MRNIFKFIILFLYIFMALALTGCGSSGLNTPPPIVQQVTLGINGSSVQKDIEDIKKGLKTNIQEELKIYWANLKKPVLVESLTVTFMRGKTEVCSNKFNLSSEQIEVSADKKYTPIIIAEKDLTALKTLSEDELFNITGVRFTVDFDSIAPASITYITTKVEAKLPVVIMSAGQSGGPFVAKALLERVSIPYDMMKAPEINDLEGGVGFPNTTLEEKDPLTFELNSTDPEGTPFKTIIVVMGASLDGIKLSNMTFKEELMRIEETIKWAKENGLTVIGMHLEEELTNSLEDKKVIETVLNGCDFVITTEIINNTGNLSNLASKNYIQLKATDSLVSIASLIEKIFVNK